MPLDDDDNPTIALAAPSPPSSSSGPSKSPSAGAAPPQAGDESLTTEDLLEDEGAAAQDFRLFRKNTHVSAQTIRKGEKDFESHGTRAQESALEASRAAMQDVLSYTRVHTPQNLVRGWYFPDWWASYDEQAEEAKRDEREEKKAFGHIRHRVVVVEGSSTATQNLGRAVTGQAKDKPARGRDWLLPEEALYLVERGSLDLWFPEKGLDEIFPPDSAKKEEEDDDGDEYKLGFPLSLQAAYALLIGQDGERGKISLRKFQVYSNLKRCGYNVLRAPPVSSQQLPTVPTPLAQTLREWFALILQSKPKHQPFGPLVQPGLYRSYTTIFQKMALIPLHKPSPAIIPEGGKGQFKVHFHIWKAAQKWTKLRHPPPDFSLSVVDAQDTDVPEMEEIVDLLDTTPPAPGKPEWTGPGRIYARLKHGHRNALLAVVDHGVINYMRFAEAAFGEEKVYERFDGRMGSGPKGGKRGGRNGGRGGGRGGRGGGRGGRGRGGR
ncbi:putative tRNA-splicing endonuclease subunit tsp-5 [Podospora australis]|uniref:tRNA-splicing endonuclease subunit tsp-5 n=1 Tax=Podospora australis TaxID=1536484 RepID=A0AAN6X2D3_9PEZI|nr:putative tRNA-splicing endonuclease subunit tsp-5 [Podospora australis]